MSRNVRVGVLCFRLVLLVIDEQTRGCPFGVVFVPQPRAIVHAQMQAFATSNPSLASNALIWPLTSNCSTRNACERAYTSG